MISFETLIHRDRVQEIREFKKLDFFYQHEIHCNATMHISIFYFLQKYQRVIKIVSLLRLSLNQLPFVTMQNTTKHKKSFGFALTSVQFQNI